MLRSQNLSYKPDKLKTVSFYDAHYIGEYMNPAVVKWNQRLLLVTGSNFGRANSKVTKNAFLEFLWFNHSFQSFADDSKYLGITTGEMDIEGSREDARVVAVSAIPTGI
jgi:hypothetical protein